MKNEMLHLHTTHIASVATPAKMLRSSIARAWWLVLVRSRKTNRQQTYIHMCVGCSCNNHIHNMMLNIKCAA